MKIKGYLARQWNTPVFVGVAKVNDLLNGGEVDTFLAGHQEGYQRSLSGARARAFGRFISGGGVSPSSILINIRDGDITEDSPGELNLPDDTIRWVVDGQHRVEGLRFAVQRDPTIGELEFPVVIMNEHSNYEEAKQFVIINKTQKGVRTDLAERFLMRAVKEEGREKLIATRDSGVLKSMLKNVEWVGKTIEIADVLNSDKKYVWYGKIRLPNEPKDGTTIAQKSFTDSLIPVLRNDFFQGKSVHAIAAALGNYWDAIRQLCGEAFERPEKHVIQKTTGVFVLHRIFPRISEFCRDDKGNRVLTKQKIMSVLEGLPFMDTKYWASDGPAGQRGTSQKSFALIAMEALEALETRHEANEPDLLI